MTRGFWWIGVVIAGCLATPHSWADNPQGPILGTKHLIAVTSQQQRIGIGSVNFDPISSDTSRFTLQLDMSLFKDYFLSMKEFKCLEGGEVSCYVPYPYPNPHTVVKGDLVWLEHSLLFLFKTPKDYGAKLWNGIYFHFQPMGKGWVARAEAIDLNLISAPSDHPEIPPFSSEFRSDYPPGARWLDQLILE